jgi:hypothetical protein
MARRFRALVTAGRLTLLISEILLLTAAFVLTTYFGLKVDPTVFLLYDGGLAQISLFLLCLLTGMYFRGLYADIRVKSRVALLQDLCLVFGIAILIQGLAGPFAPGLRLPLARRTAGQPGSGGDRSQPLVSSAPVPGPGDEAVLVRPGVAPADSDRA